GNGACEVEGRRTAGRPARPDLVIGIDLGVNHLAVVSTPIPDITDPNGFVANPRHLDAALRKVRRTCRVVSRRVGPDLRTNQTSSRRWERANRTRNQLCYRVANLRRDGLHKFTSGLARPARLIATEDRKVAGLVRNHRVARQVADAGFG